MNPDPCHAALGTQGRFCVGSVFAIGSVFGGHVKYRNTFDYAQYSEIDAVLRAWARQGQTRILKRLGYPPLSTLAKIDAAQVIRRRTVEGNLPPDPTAADLPDIAKELHAPGSSGRPLDWQRDMLKASPKTGKHAWGYDSVGDDFEIAVKDTELGRDFAEETFLHIDDVVRAQPDLDRHALAAFYLQNQVAWIELCRAVPSAQRRDDILRRAMLQVKDAIGCTRDRVLLRYFPDCDRAGNVESLIAASLPLTSYSETFLRRLLYTHGGGCYEGYRVSAEEAMQRGVDISPDRVWYVWSTSALQNYYRGSSQEEDLLEHAYKRAAGVGPSTADMVILLRSRHPEYDIIGTAPQAMKAIAKAVNIRPARAKDLVSIWPLETVAQYQLVMTSTERVKQAYEEFRKKVAAGARDRALLR